MILAISTVNCGMWIKLFVRFYCFIVTRLLICFQEEWYHFKMAKTYLVDIYLTENFKKLRPVYMYRWDIQKNLFDNMNNLRYDILNICWHVNFKKRLSTSRWWCIWLFVKLCHMVFCFLKKYSTPLLK